MIDEDFKKLRDLIKEELRATKDLVEMTKKKVDSQDLLISTTAENVRRIKEQQSLINEKLDEVRDTQEKSVLPSVTTIEQNIKVYADMYKLNNDNMKKLEKRLEPLEDNAGIQPPPELTLAEVQ